MANCAWNIIKSIKCCLLWISIDLTDVAMGLVSLENFLLSVESSRHVGASDHCRRSVVWRIGDDILEGESKAWKEVAGWAEKRWKLWKIMQKLLHVNQQTLAAVENLLVSQKCRHSGDLMEFLPMVWVLWETWGYHCSLLINIRWSLSDFISARDKNLFHLVLYEELLRNLLNTRKYFGVENSWNVENVIDETKTSICSI